MPKGEKYWENVWEERLICEFKGVKERHIRFFNFYGVVCARIV
jgi:hypothetical protein